MRIALTPMDCYLFEKNNVEYKTIDDYVKIKDLSIDHIKTFKTKSVFDMYLFENTRSKLNYEGFAEKVFAENNRDRKHFD